MLAKLLDEVEKAMYRPDPERVARRLLETAVDATQARGGELRLRNGRRPLVVATPGWKDGVTAEVVAPIRQNGAAVGHMALAARTDGRPYSPSEVAALEAAVARLPASIS